MTAEGISRRGFLQGSGLTGAALLLAACTPASVDGPSGSPIASGSPSPEPSTTPLEQRPTGPLTFANRAGNIDLEADGVTSPTLAGFEEAVGVSVHYAGAAVDEDEAFVAVIRPQLEQGVGTGWDLAVLADWMAARVVAREWAEPIDASHVPAAASNLAADLARPPWDSEQRFHYPWAAFSTGIAWSRAATGRDLTGIADLFAPEMSGRITLLRSARDTLPMLHLLLRARGSGGTHPPDEMTVEDARAAIEFLRPFVDSGHVRRFTTTEHIGDLVTGAVSAALATSRELAPLVGETEGYAYPVEGWLAWSDSLVIPRAARHRYTAELLVNWVYEPENAARIVSAIRSISPVRGVADALARLDNAPRPEDVAWSLLFPPAGVQGRRHRRPTWSQEVGEEIDGLFGELLRSSDA